MLKNPLIRGISWYLVFAIFIIGIAPRVEAGFAPSNPISLPETDRDADLSKIQKVLETKMVKERLEKLGFTKEEITNRLHQLSDQQIHQLALKLDELKVGGDLGVVIALLVIIILVIVILQLTGHKVIITK